MLDVLGGLAVQTALLAVQNWQIHQDLWQGRSGRQLVHNSLYHVAKQFAHDWWSHGHLMSPNHAGGQLLAEKLPDEMGKALLGPCSCPPCPEIQGWQKSPVVAGLDC